jgi:hypothetical protein
VLVSRDRHRAPQRYCRSASQRGEMSSEPLIPRLARVCQLNRCQIVL